MDIDFALRGRSGRVGVTCMATEQPELLGSGPDARGFPMCQAVVDYPNGGYDAVLGWVQLVRSDDNLSHGEEYEIDPLAFLGDVPHPFCWIGIEPTLFDLPSRVPREDLDWSARSFLCVPDSGADGGMEVHALLGFSWGFTIRNEEIVVVPPQVVGPAEWNEHTAALASLYPSWRFLDGFREG